MPQVKKVLTLVLSSDPSGVRAEIQDGTGGWFATAGTPREALLHALSLIPESELPPPATPEALADTYVALYPTTVRGRLSEACRTGAVVRITGTKQTGDRYEDRPVQVRRIDEGRWVRCMDITLGEHRTFLFDRIEKVD